MSPEIAPTYGVINHYSQFLVNRGYKSDWKNIKVEKF